MRHTLLALALLCAGCAVGGDANASGANSVARGGDASAKTSLSLALGDEAVKAAWSAFDASLPERAVGNGLAAAVATERKRGVEPSEPDLQALRLALQKEAEARRAGRR